MGLLILLSGCSSENRELVRAMSFRDRLLEADGCSFYAVITADYGDLLHRFLEDCTADAAGNLSFVVTAPESISGIRGTVSEKGGTLDFEDTALYFDLLTDDQLTPVSAPWIFLRTLRSGCITSVCMDADMLRITADDSYADDALQLDIWLNEADVPVRGEILYDGRRILSVDVEDFVFS